MAQKINTYVTTVPRTAMTLAPVSPLPNLVELVITLVMALLSPPQEKRPIRKMRRESKHLHFLKAISISHNYGYGAVNWNQVAWPKL